MMSLSDWKEIETDFGVLCFVAREMDRALWLGT
jgi:hypothetical protein